MVGRRMIAFIERRSLSTQVVAAVSAFFAALAVGTICFHWLEDWTWIEAFYFSTSTLTTVGYGDLTPTSDTSRLCAAIYMIIGVTIALASLGVIGSSYISRRESLFIQQYNAAKAREDTKKRTSSTEEEKPSKDDE